MRNDPETDETKQKRLRTDGGALRNLEAVDITVEQVATRDGDDITTQWAASCEAVDRAARGATPAEAVDVLVSLLEDKDELSDDHTDDWITSDGDGE